MSSDVEQMYVFIDNSGQCFKAFQAKGNGEMGRSYHNMVGLMLLNAQHFTVGDMLAFRDDLFAAGFKWGKDFHIKKL